MFFVNFRENKVTLYKNEKIEDYLNYKTNIENVACFNQIARIFNLETTFCSFFLSDFNNIVKHKMFKELDINLVQKLLRKPAISRWYNLPRCNCGKRLHYYVKKHMMRLTDAAYIWIDHNILERSMKLNY